MDGTCLEHIAAGLVGFFGGICDVCPRTYCLLVLVSSRTFRTLNSFEKANQVSGGCRA